MIRSCSLLVSLLLAPLCIGAVAATIAGLNIAYGILMSWFGFQVTLPQMAAFNCSMAVLSTFLLTSMFLTLKRRKEAPSVQAVEIKIEKPTTKTDIERAA